MIHIALWLVVGLGASMALWAHRQAKLTRQFADKVIALEQRTEQLTSHLQRALEDSYVLTMILTERGQLDPDDLTRGRERFIEEPKRREKQRAQGDFPKVEEADLATAVASTGRGTLH